MFRLTNIIMKYAPIGVAAAIYLGQKTFTQIPRQVDRFVSRRYAIIGPWHDPKIYWG